MSDDKTQIIPFNIEDDRRVKPQAERLRREIQVLLNDETFLAILQLCPGDVKVSAFVRDLIQKDPRVVEKIEEIRIMQSQSALASGEK